MAQNLSCFLAAKLRGSRGELRQTSKFYAMAGNITVELLSGKVCTLAVRPEMTIAELKEEMKVRSGQHLLDRNGCLNNAKFVTWKLQSGDRGP